MLRANRVPMLVLVIGILAVSCGGRSSSETAPLTGSNLRVVTTTAILADFVRNVGGARVEVTSLIQPGADVHSFQSTPGDSIALSNAGLIVSNGLSLDVFLDPLLRSATGPDAVHVEVLSVTESAYASILSELEELVTDLRSGKLTDDAGEPGKYDQPMGPDITSQDQELAASRQQQGWYFRDLEEASRSLTLLKEARDGLLAEYRKQENGDGPQARDQRDPHLWQNPLYAVYYVETIRDGLSEADPDGATIYHGNAAAYIKKLLEMDDAIARNLGQVPPLRRNLVTFHNAFGHFADRYGWKVSAFVLTDSGGVTPGDVVDVMETIKNEGIKAVFAEPQFNSVVLSQAAKDTGVTVGTIYSDSLDDVAPTYIDMMMFNLNSLLEHLLQLEGG